MRRLLGAVQVFGGAALVAMCVATLFEPFAAFGGDTLLGVILVSDGGTVSNATTGYGSAGCNRQTQPGGAAACAQAFPIPPAALLSVQCQDNSAHVAVNKFTTDAGEGVKLAADQFFSTSTSNTNVSVPALASNNSGCPDGGTYVGGVVSISPIAGNSTARCKVYSRQGNE